MSTLSTTTKTRLRTHPGEVLREEFMVPLGLSANALARAIKVPPNRITAIIAEQSPRAVTPDTALRLARCLGTSPRFWLNLQLAHDLALAERESGPQIARDISPLNKLDS
jgi:addiction module HigA family antidote